MRMNEHGHQRVSRGSCFFSKAGKNIFPQFCPVGDPAEKMPEMFKRSQQAGRAQNQFQGK